MDKFIYILPQPTTSRRRYFKTIHWAGKQDDESDPYQEIQEYTLFFNYCFGRAPQKKQHYDVQAPAQTLGVFSCWALLWLAAEVSFWNNQDRPWWLNTSECSGSAGCAGFHGYCPLMHDRYTWWFPLIIWRIPLQTLYTNPKITLYSPIYVSDLTPIALQSSSLHQLPLLSTPAQVYAIKWHMGHYGSASAKPEKGWTNNRKFQHLNKGKFAYKKNPGTLKTVKRTINKETGKVSTTGTKDLKSTQFCPYFVCA